MPTEAPTWEETTEIEPLWEETTPFEEPVSIERPDMVVQPQTGVVQSAAPGSVAPTDLKPSVRLIGGEQVTGQIGDTHPEIIKRESIPAVDIDQRGFQGPGGEFFPRESAAIATGLPTEMEPTRLHSTDLAASEKRIKPLPADSVSAIRPPTFEAPIRITEEGPVYRYQQEELERQKALWSPTIPVQPPSLEPVRETETPPLFTLPHVPGTGIPLTDVEKVLGPSEQTQKDQIRLEILRNAVDLASKEAQRDLTKAELAKIGEDAARAVDFIGAIQRIPTEQGLLGAIGKPVIAAGEGTSGVLFGQGLNRIAEDVAAGDLNFPRFRNAVGRTRAGVGFSPLEKGAVELGNILPDIALTTAGQVAGVPAPVTFGTLSAARAAAEGAPPEQVLLAGATGAAAPGAGAIGTKAAATVLKGAVNRGLLSGNREMALKALESLGGQAGFQTFFAGMSLPEIAALPPGKRWDFIVEQGIKNSVFSVLDIPKFKRGIPSETRKALISDFLDTLSKQGPMGSVLKAPAERGVVTGLGTEEVPTIKNLMEWTPEQFAEWKSKSKTYGATQMREMASRVTPEELKQLEASRDSLRKEIADTLSSVEGGSLEERMKAAQSVQLKNLKAQTLNEMVENAPKPEPAKKTKAVSEEPTPVVTSIEPELELATQAGLVRGMQGNPMSEEAIWSRLKSRYGIDTSGSVSVVFKPEASHAGLFIFDKNTGKPIGIELNRANIPTEGVLHSILEHEAAHWFDMENPGRAAGILIDTVTSSEWKQIDRQIMKLGYSVESAGTERTARGIQALANNWRNRTWFEKIVGNLQRFASDFLGVKLSRKAAENSAVRAIAQSIERSKSPRPRTVSELGAIESAGGKSQRLNLDRLEARVAPIGEAAEQLTERLKATPAVGTRDKLSLRETIADAWGQGKAIFDRSRARAQAVTETIKDAARGAREPSELDKRVGELDWLLQRAAGQSRDMGKTMRKQVRDANLRRAAAIWIDTPGDAATKTSTIRTALSDLQLNPELWRKTPNEVKRAMETAANMPAEGIQFAESLREYYARRNQDAVDHSLFEHGLEDYFTHVWGNEKNMPDDLRGAIGGGRVQTYWQFSRQRKLGTFLDGIMRGKIPQLDPSNVLPFYNYTLDRAIASRSFIKNITDNMVASDGRAVVAPTGTLSRVPQGQPTEASLVRPKGKTGEIADYKTINHPALRKWKWMANDENGKPILSQNDLVVHPEHYERLARMMDMSRLKGSRVSEALLRASTEVKGFKLGLLSAFHQVHVGSHALFHWTLPFNFKDPRFFTPEGDIRWNSPDVRFAIEKGHLKIAPDARELKIFAEGLLSPGLIHKIPVVGPWSRAYSEWTFGEYIPKLKLKTFAAAMPRNLRWYRGKLSEDAIAARVGDAVNNAYGELNNLFLGKIGRNPGTQRMLRGIFLAPDFGEARLRFVGKGLTSYGTEERLALATMFITLYTAARVGNWLSHGDPELDPKRAFQVKSGKHWWSMRSVIGDLDRAFLDTSRFFYVRLNPLYSRTAADWLFGRDINGRKLSPMEKIVKRPLNQLVPIQFQALTRDDQALWESFVGSIGVSAISDTPQQDVYRLVDNWMKNSDDPKLQAAFKRREAEVFPPSDYTKLRYALRHDDEKGAKKAYAELLKTRKPSTITDAMLPGKPFTGSYPNELKFRNSLTDAQRKVYDQARQEQKEMYSKFQIIRRSPEPVEKEPTWEETVPVTE